MIRNITASAIALFLFGFSGFALNDGEAKSDWTIMVFMNAKNNLECAGLTNFRQMASIGSSEKVNLVVELGRPTSNHRTPDEEGWSGVLRFRVTKGMHPVPSSAIDPDDPNVRTADMGDGATLSAFVQWAQKQYPAQKYMLIVWNHGQGWRLYQAESISQVIPASYRDGFSGQDEEAKPCDGPSGETLTGGVRSVSFDEDTGHFLYNRAIQDSLHDKHLNIVGFDACLMAMIESAYAFRHIADLMIASEELVPGEGWNYELWLQHLIEHPNINPIELSKYIVRSYKDTYKDSGETTLSVIDLSKIDKAVRELTKLSLLAKSKMASQGAIIGSARLSFRTFGDWYEDSWQDCQGSRVARFLGIDLGQFLNVYGRQSGDAEIKREAAKVREKLKRTILSNYASATSAGADHWASGIAVYFPGTELEFQCDADHEGYNLEAVRAGLIPYAPEFVEQEGWSDLLRAYLQWRKSPKPERDF